MESHEVDKNEERSHKIEYLVALILGVATILGAMSAYYAALWGETNRQVMLRAS